MTLHLLLLFQTTTPTVPKLYRLPATYVYYAKHGNDPKCDENTRGAYAAAIQVESGKVAKQQFLTGDQALFERSKEVVASWKYDPVKVEHQAVSWVGFIAFSFSGAANCHVSPSFYGRDPREVDKDTNQAHSPVRISGGVAAGQKISGGNPIYPQKAKDDRLSGSVVISAVIGTDGSLELLHVISGHPLLAEAALMAVQTWQYKPYTLNGVPIPVETTITVNFNLA